MCAGIQVTAYIEMILPDCKNNLHCILGKETRMELEANTVHVQDWHETTNYSIGRRSTSKVCMYLWKFFNTMTCNVVQNWITKRSKLHFPLLTACHFQTHAYDSNIDGFPCTTVHNECFWDQQHIKLALWSTGEVRAGAHLVSYSSSNSNLWRWIWQWTNWWTL